MHILIRAAMLLAAGAAGWALAKKKAAPRNEENGSHVVFLSDEEAKIDACEHSDLPVPARVRSSYRRMDPITLSGASDVTFLLEDETEIRLLIPGESGIHLKPGDRGLLTRKGIQFICFEKENGDVIGSLFYASAEVSKDE